MTRGTVEVQARQGALGLTGEPFGRLEDLLDSIAERTTALSSCRKS